MTAFKVLVNALRTRSEWLESVLIDKRRDRPFAAVDHIMSTQQCSRLGRTSLRRRNPIVSELTELNHYRLGSVGLTMWNSLYFSSMASVVAPLVAENCPLPQKRRPL